MQAPAVPGETAPLGDGSAADVHQGKESTPAGDVPASRGLGVLSRLRTATAAAHTRVEARMFPSALDDLHSYRRMLAVLLSLHEPLEQAFARQPGFAGLGIDVARRRKAAVLRNDLARLDARLGVPAPRPAPVEPLPADHPALAPATVTSPSGPAAGSLPGVLGAFYVLEGSTLGGRFLLPEVRERLGDVPTDFLAGYGEQTGRMWKQTQNALVRVVAEAPRPPAAEQALVAGADATFAHLDALLDRAGWVGQPG